MSGSEPQVPAAIDPAVLLALAERCERAEPSDDLDCAIAAGVRGASIAASEVPYYTTSLDAAVTLVPKGWHLHLAGSKYGKASACLHRAFGSPAADEVVWRKGHSWPAQHMATGRAKTEPLARCAAALRARAAITKAEGFSEGLRDAEGGATPEGTPISKEQT